MSVRRRRLRRNRQNRMSLISIRLIAAVFAVMLILAATGAAFGFTLVSKWLEDLPDYTKPGAFEVARPTKIFAADGTLLARLYLENREVIPISQMSTDLVNAIVAVEDERFFKHKGVDPAGIIRAAVTNVQTPDSREGASTITQQYIRNTILLNERTDISLQRKVREAYLAIQVERRYKKREILAMYLNAIYFGEGAHGAQAAARTYFAKSAKDLTVAEAALLAGLPQQPSRLDPFDNLAGATARRNQVLVRMLKNKYISKAAYDVAIAEPVTLRRAKEPEDGMYAAPYFVAHVKKELQAKFSPAVVFKGGLTVTTSLDMKLQGYAEDAVNKKLENGGPEGALVSIDPRTGYVKALVGGRDYHKNKYNIATQGYRQPGSSFKTFVLVTAIEEGMPPYFNIDSSSPAYIKTKPKPWIVSNSEGAGHGMMSLRSATAASVNTVFARVAFEIGAKKIAKVAKRMGITSDVPEYPSIALGTHNVTPMDMAASYGTLATGGIRNDPIVITKVVDGEGKTILSAEPTRKRALKPEVAAAATDVLQGVINGGTATRARIGRPAAGKTGTSQNYRDVWFVGYTPQLVTSVWVGYRQERTIFVNGSHAFGGTVCAPIWADYMERALEGQPKLDFPKAKQPKYTPAKFNIPVSRPPSLAGLKLTEAEKKLRGIDYQIEYAYSTRPKGTVIRQSGSGSKLTIVVSKGLNPATSQPVQPPPDVIPPEYIQPPPSDGTTQTP